MRELDQLISEVPFQICGSLHFSKTGHNRISRAVFYLLPVHRPSLSRTKDYFPLLASEQVTVTALMNRMWQKWHCLTSEDRWRKVASLPLLSLSQDAPPGNPSWPSHWEWTSGAIPAGLLPPLSSSAEQRRLCNCQMLFKGFTVTGRDQQPHFRQRNLRPGEWVR